MDATDYHGCAVLSDGSVRCWGGEDCHENGSGPQRETTALQTVSVRDALAVTTGRRFSCALSRVGQVWCWGAPQGGDHDAPPFCDGIAHPALIAGLSDVTELAAGDNHVCALDRAGGVWCWGDNRFGQLGTGPTPGPKRAAPSSFRSLRSRAPGGRRHHVHPGSGGVRSMLGNGFRPDDRGFSSTRANPMRLIDGATSMMVGHEFACALAHDRVFCFGDRIRGRPAYLSDPRAFHDAPPLPRSNPW